MASPGGDLERRLGTFLTLYVLVRRCSQMSLSGGAVSATAERPTSLEPLHSRAAQALVERRRACLAGRAAGRAQEFIVQPAGQPKIWLTLVLSFLSGGYC